MTNTLNHFDDNGQAHMVDIGDKETTNRQAVAKGTIAMSALAFELIASGGHKKGDVLGIARVAGIMAAKKTSDLIPLCHPLPLTHISIDFTLQPSRSEIDCRVLVKTNHRTGVEMEALTALNLSLLTIYDMCKAVDKFMQISNIHLVEKQGGKSGNWHVDNAPK